MKKYFLLFFLFTACLAANAQNGNWCWAKSGKGIFNYYDEAYNVATDKAGNVYVTGWFTSPTLIFGTDTLTNSGGENIFLVKYNPSGNVLWAKAPIRSTSDPAEGMCIATDNSGNVYLTGHFVSPQITFGSYTLNNNGSWNFFLTKYDPNGIVLWATAAVKNSAFTTASLGVSVDKVGNVYATGYFASNAITFGNITLSDSGSTDIFIVKYDSSGTSLWAKSAGGIKTEMSYGVSADNFGNVYIADRKS